MSGVDLTRWSRVAHADGSIVLTAPATHPAFAAERRATLRIRDDVRALDAAYAGARVVTRAGEYGALRTRRVTVGGEVLNAAVGVIAGGERLTVIEGLARSPNIVALVRDVLDEWVPAAAFDRIRMVPYRPPVGWFGVRRTLATCWLAPRAPARIIVGDAVPRGPAERMHALLWPLDAPADDGRHWAVAQAADARWIVRAALEAGDAQDLVTLRELVASIELPLPPSHAAPGADPYRWMAL